MLTKINYRPVHAVGRLVVHIKADGFNDYNINYATGKNYYYKMIMIRERTQLLMRKGNCIKQKLQKKIG